MNIKIDNSYSDKPIRAFIDLLDREDAETITEIESKELFRLICTQILLLKATCYKDWD